jgi:hypothetical protein
VDFNTIIEQCLTFQTYTALESHLNAVFSVYDSQVEYFIKLGQRVWEMAKERGLEEVLVEYIEWNPYAISYVMSSKDNFNGECDVFAAILTVCDYKSC